MTDNNDSNQVDGSEKLRNDLDAVMEKVQLCREIMLESPGIEQDETLAGVIGFLEACRDRLNELIEAGAQGQLSEELFERCFTVNDAVSKTLEAERTGTKLSVKDGLEGSTKEKASKDENLLDLGGDKDDEDEDKEFTIRKVTGSSSISPQKDKSFSKPKTQQKQEDSLLAPYVAPTPATATAAPSVEEDPFGADFDTKPIDLPVPPSPTPWDNATAIPATTTQPVPATATSTPAASAAVEDNSLAGLTTNLAATSVSPPPAPTPSTAATTTATAAEPTTTTVPSSTTSTNHAANAAAEFDAFLESLDQPAKKDA